HRANKRDQNLYLPAYPLLVHNSPQHAAVLIIHSRSFLHLVFHFSSPLQKKHPEKKEKQPTDVSADCFSECFIYSVSSSSPMTSGSGIEPSSRTPSSGSSYCVGAETVNKE